jgi:hypothetical protein
VYTPNPTQQTYVPLLAAYHHFNQTLFLPLFGVLLPDALITLQRQVNTDGYFSAGQFAAIDGDARTDEIALNPARFRVSMKRMESLSPRSCSIRSRRPCRGASARSRWPSAARSTTTWLFDRKREPIERWAGCRERSFSF